jgi:hypothetical protein
VLKFAFRCALLQFTGNGLQILALWSFTVRFGMQFF